MRFNDAETDIAIRIVTSVKRDSGRPLLPPDKVDELKRMADAGDEEAYIAWMTAMLRMVYPVCPSGSSSDRVADHLAAGGSNYAKLWSKISEGWLEGIEFIKVLNYGQAWEDTLGGTVRAAYGSYFDSFCNTAIRNALIRMLL